MMDVSIIFQPPDDQAQEVGGRDSEENSDRVRKQRPQKLVFDRSSGAPTAGDRGTSRLPAPAGRRLHCCSTLEMIPGLRLGLWFMWAMGALALSLFGFARPKLDRWREKRADSGEGGAK
jgi:hypothetical protein